VIESSSSSLDIEQLIQKVREEAARRQQEAAPAETAPAPRRWLYSLGELLRHDDAEFVTGIYWGVLHREPDPGGLQDRLSRLRNGECNKIDLLRELRFSPEGEAVGVEVQGLLPPSRWRLPDPPMLESPAELPIRDRYTLDELLQYRDDAFVRNVYRALLHREPDAAGWEHHLEKLRSGACTRMDIIQGLRLGSEGRAIAVELTDWPKMEEGALPDLNTSRAEERASYGLPELLEPLDETFVDHAYRALLRREPDTAGKRHHLEQLRSGRSTKIEILGQLRYSPEGHRVGVTVRGLRLPFMLQTAYRLPVIGSVLALATLILRPRHLITRLRWLEARDDWSQAQEAKNRQHLAQELALIQRVADLQVVNLELAQVKQGVRELANELIQIKWLADAKANGGEWLDLQQSLRGLERDRASVADLAEMRQTLAGKAEAAHLDEAWQTLAGKAEVAHLDEVWQVLTGKAEVAHLDEVWRALANKAEATHLDEAWRALAGKAEAAHLDEAWRVLAGKAEVAHLDEAWQVLAGKADAVDLTQMHQAFQDRTRQELNQMHQRLLTYQRNLADQQRRLGLLLEEARKRLPAPLDEQQLATLAREQDHLMDALYVSFEDHFRGARTDIQQRLQLYLPYLRQTGAGLEGHPILDLGCGRGEWLELLTQEGFVARGIDLNRTMVAECRERGLIVDEAEALACLRALPDGSLGAVTGLHIIEHLPLAVLVGVLDEALRTVRPGGIVIFETPNPENLMVSAYNFYFDPTHRNPLPPLLSSFLLEGRGWTPVEIMRLNPYPEHQRFSVEGGQSQVTSWLNEVFCGPQDYAVIGHKP